MLETDFKKKVKDEIKQKFPDSIITKTDASDIQGIPDMIIFFKNKWAALEFKKSKESRKQPNQLYYLKKMNKMSFASIIFPENKKEVLDELEKFFRG